MNVEGIIGKLLNLQKIDIEIDHIRENFQQAPDQLSTIQAAFKSKQETLTGYQNQLAAAEKERGSMEETLRLEEERLKKSKLKVKQIKTNYEFQAMNREIESTKRSNDELAEKMVEKSKEIENIKKVIEEWSVQVDALQKEMESLKGQVSASSGEFQEKIKAMESEQQAFLEGMDRTLLSRYRMIRERRYRNAVVAVLNGTCQGCFMNVMHQQLNEMLRENKVSSCPNCHRLIYIEPTNQ